MVDTVGIFLSAFAPAISGFLNGGFLPSHLVAFSCPSVSLSNTVSDPEKSVCLVSCGVEDTSTSESQFTARSACICPCGRLSQFAPSPPCSVFLHKIKILLLDQPFRVSLSVHIFLGTQSFVWARELESDASFPLRCSGVVFGVAGV